VQARISKILAIGDLWRCKIGMDESPILVCTAVQIIKSLDGAFRK